MGPWSLPNEATLALEKEEQKSEIKKPALTNFIHRSWHMHAFHCLHGTKIFIYDDYAGDSEDEW